MAVPTRKAVSLGVVGVSKFPVRTTTAWRTSDWGRVQRAHPERLSSSEMWAKTSRNHY